MTLWVVYSWLHEHERFATHSPVLLVRSAEKDSGKTTLLGIITFLTRRALNSVEISGAALFRSIAKWQPTFVIDEGDDVLTDNADLRSVLNSGWTRGQTVIRCHHDTHEPESFSTFAPKVLGMKGDKLPDTTLSRSLAIDMKPKLAGEWIADFDHLDNETFERLRRQVLRWATDNAEALAARQPEIPQDFHNRRRANWRPLLAIAEAMDVKQAGWEAALEIERRQIAVDPSTGIQLLTAIRFIFDEMKAEPSGHGAGRKGPDHHRSARAGTDRHSRQPLGHLWPERQADHRRPGHPAAQALRHQVGERADSERRQERPTRATCGIGSRMRSRAISRPLAEAETASDFSGARNPASEPGTPGHNVENKGLFAKIQPGHKTPLCRVQNPANPLKTLVVPGVSGFEEGFSGGEKTDRTDSAEDAPADPHDIPTDRTCVQCHGEIDGTERLVAVSGRAVWLHPSVRTVLAARARRGPQPGAGAG